MQLACAYDVVGYKFTGKERDAESGLWFYEVRSEWHTRENVLAKAAYVIRSRTTNSCVQKVRTNGASARRQRRRVQGAVLFIAVIALVCILSACGGSSSSGVIFSGGGSNNGGGGSSGGGGGKQSLSISLIEPSSINTGVNLALLNVYGQNFIGAQVYIDGVQSQLTIAGSASAQALLPTSLPLQTGVHQITVQNSDGTVSNALPFTVYNSPNGPQVMQALPAYLVGDYTVNTKFVITADMNNDGRSDVILPGPAMGNGGTVAILYGQADGSLSSTQYVPTTPLSPSAIAAGDINKDGNVDLALLTATAPNTLVLTVLLGDGHGNFTPGPTEPTLPQGNIPGPAYLADLDGDGLPDLVYTYYFPLGPAGTGGLVWLKNTGNGTFAAPVSLASVVPSNLFAIADFNHDGKLDLLYAAPTSPQALRILMNSGNGNFADIPVGGLNGIYGMVSVIDFNLDGIPDLVIQVPNALTGTMLYSFAGSGNGSFTQVASVNIGGSSTQLLAGDFDHDGFPDLVGTSGSQPNYLLYLFGDGRGNFTPQQVTGPAAQYIATGDFNGDGLPDVVLPDEFNFVCIALGRTDRNLQYPLTLYPATATGISAGDVNGDGWPELLVGGDRTVNIPATIFQNQQNNNFSLAAYLDPTAFGLSDLTGKGVADLLGGANNLIIWPNNGTMNFSSSPITQQQPMPNVVVADLDGDGLADIISGCSGGVTCPGQIFWGTGSYQFSPVTIPNLYAPYAVGDFNGDGRLDFLAAGGTFLNAGGRQFQEVDAQLPSMGLGALFAVGDFNGDGFDDIAITLPGDLSIGVFYGRGDGTFYFATDIDTGDTPGALVAGRFTGTGKSDIAAGMVFSHEVCIYSSISKDQFSRSCFAQGAQTDTMISTDLNHDGKPDLAITNSMFIYAPATVSVVYHK